MANKERLTLTDPVAVDKFYFAYNTALLKGLDTVVYTDSLNKTHTFSRSHAKYLLRVLNGELDPQ